MWWNNTKSPRHTQSKWEENASASPYLCSCRRTLFSHHTPWEFHCSLSHRCHPHSPSLHRSATAQGRSSRQDCTETPSHCTFQEREFLRKIRITLKNLLVSVFFFPFQVYTGLESSSYPKPKSENNTQNALFHPVTHHSNISFKQTLSYLLTSFTPPSSTCSILIFISFSHLSDRKEFGGIRHKDDEVSLVFHKNYAQSSSCFPSSFLLLLFYPTRSIS